MTLFLTNLSTCSPIGRKRGEYRRRCIAVDKLLTPLRDLCKQHHSDPKAIDVLRYCNDSLFAFEILNT